MNYKQNLIKETQYKLNILQKNLQETELSNFSKVTELENLAKDIAYNMGKLKFCVEINNFNNKESKKNGN